MAFKELKNESGVSLGYLQTDAQERLGVHNLMHVQDRKAKGTGGGAFTSGAWRTRELNSVLVNNIAGASLADNRITLPPGTYFLSASAPAHYCAHNNVAIYNVSTTSVLLTGAGWYAPNVGNVSAIGRSFAEGIFTLAGSSIIELQHFCSATMSSDGLGPAMNIAGLQEIYSDLKIWKVA